MFPVWYSTNRENSVPNFRRPGTVRQRTIQFVTFNERDARRCCNSLVSSKSDDRMYRGPAGATFTQTVQACARTRRCRLALRGRVRRHGWCPHPPIPPLVKQASMNPESPRQPRYVVTGERSLYRTTTQFLVVALLGLSFHFAVPPCKMRQTKVSQNRGSLPAHQMGH